MEDCEEGKMMIKKKCNFCGVFGWHNPMKKAKEAEQQYRCCYCGSPVTNAKDSPKKLQGEFVRDRQVSRARLMNIMEL